MRASELRAHARSIGLAALALLAGTACEDPARPGPDEALGASVFVDSDPQGGRILIGGDDTGEVTPARIGGLDQSAFTVGIVLDTGAFRYSFSDFVAVSPELLDVRVEGPLTLRCTTPQCLRSASQFHAIGSIRFAVNAAGPPFLYDGIDVGIAWPSSTSNSYASLGAATMTALLDGAPLALGLRNVGVAPNYWAGRPLPTVDSTGLYSVRVPAWITPPVPATEPRLRGVRIEHEVRADAALDNVLHVHVTWTNISADSVYRLLDPAVPANGVSYSEVWLGFLLDADVGAFAESNDDLVSYSPEDDLVFAYDSDFAVAGFSGGWSDDPGLIGLMVLDAPGSVRLNAWPVARDFLAGADAAGRALITAAQTEPENHPDGRIGYAPDDQDADYILSAAAGPIDLPPGASATVHFAVILAAPAAGAFTSGTPLPAGDPLDGERPLAAAAANLLSTARSLRVAAP